MSVTSTKVVNKLNTVKNSIKGHLQSTLPVDISNVTDSILDYSVGLVTDQLVVNRDFKNAADVAIFEIRLSEQAKRREITKRGINTIATIIVVGTVVDKICNARYERKNKLRQREQDLETTKAVINFLKSL